MLYGKKKGATTFTELVEIVDVPDMGSEPEQIEVTTLKSIKKQYIEGRQDSPVQAFTYNATKENYFDRVMPYCNREIHEFLLVFPDKTGVLIIGSARTNRKGYGRNSAREATLSITPMDIQDKTNTEVEALLVTA